MDRKQQLSLCEEYIKAEGLDELALLRLNE